MLKERELKILLNYLFSTVLFIFCIKSYDKALAYDDPAEGFVTFFPLLISSSPLQATDMSLSPDAYKKLEKLSQEAVTHLAVGEIISPSEGLTSFLKSFKKKNERLTDLEILELLVDKF